MDQRRMRALAAIEDAATSAALKREASGNRSATHQTHKTKKRKTEQSPAHVKNNINTTKLNNKTPKRNITTSTSGEPKRAQSSAKSSSNNNSNNRPAQSRTQSRAEQLDLESRGERYRSFMERTLRQRLGSNSGSLIATLKGRAILLDNPHKGGDSDAMRIEREKRGMANAARTRGLTKSQKRVLYGSLRAVGMSAEGVRRLHQTWKQYFEEQLLLATGSASIGVLREVLGIKASSGAQQEPQQQEGQVKTQQRRAAEKAVTQCVATAALQGALVYRHACSSGWSKPQVDTHTQRAIVVHETANGLFVIPLDNDFSLDDEEEEEDNDEDDVKKTAIIPTKMKAKLWIKRSLSNVLLLLPANLNDGTAGGMALEVQLSRLREGDRIGQLAVK